jgi:hypothetical protein
MTQDQKRIKIAEACGWKTGYRDLEAWRPLPDYFSDLNATHKAEKVIVDWVAYRINLSRVVGIGCAPDLDICDDIKSFLSATAAQRAEAFGLTLGLWKEGE